MSGNVEECVCIITGTSKGIGKSLEKLLTNRFQEVISVNRSDVDLSNPESTIRFLDALGLEDRRIVFINNAASLGPIVPVGRQDPQDIVKCINVNLTSPMLFINFLASTGLKWKYFNITTGAINTVNKYLGTYSVSKLALKRYLDFIKLEEQESGCEGIYDYYPPLTNTTMNAALERSQFFSNEKFDKTTPKKCDIVAKEVFDFIVKNSYA